jgi:hypothetical protein
VEILGCEKITAVLIAPLTAASFAQLPFAARPAAHFLCAEAPVGENRRDVAVKIKDRWTKRVMSHLTV